MDDHKVAEAMMIRGIIISIFLTFAFFQICLSEVDKCHFSSRLFFPEKSRNSFFYPLYEYNVSDEILAEDKEFLITNYRNEGNDYLANARYFLASVAKLFNSDSIFVHRYEPSVFHHSYQYILVDLAHINRILLNNFSKDDFNLWIKNLAVNDYIYLSQLYIVLGNIDKAIIFLDDGSSIFLAADAIDPCLLVSNTEEVLDRYDEFEKRYCQEIKPPVLRNVDDKHIVELFAYIWSDYKILKYRFIFQDKAITSIDSELLVDRREVAKLLGIDPDFIRDE
jgi:hypothetical protein